MSLLGVRLVGLTAENGLKLLLSVILVLVVWLGRRLLHRATAVVLRGDALVRVRFWIRQAWSVLAAAVLAIGLVSLWFDDPARLATALGLVTAGLAFALQKVITAVAGYFVVIRGKVFSVGDRIVMGGVRGDVIDLAFTQTRIMEMGQPPPVQKDEPAMWIHNRQYTGRIVSVSNGRIFDEPVYNYTREFPYLWEEIQIPISYTADRVRAEQILLEVARRRTTAIQDMSEPDRVELMRRYSLGDPDLTPRVYWRLTDNWLELTVRFVARDHAIRALKDEMSRDILAAFDAAGIGIASATFEIVGLPKVDISLSASPASLVRGASSTG
jgi:small-conductance mechanosensitive channel